MNVAILRLKKLKRANVAGSSAHVMREISTPNADPQRSRFNQILKGRGKTPVQQISSLVSKISDQRSLSGKKRLRSDAVWAVEFVMTVEQSHWRGKDGGYVKDWAKRSLSFLNSKYGEARIVSAVLHLDETSPHIHAYMVPVSKDSDGIHTLSAKRFFDGRGKLAKLQDEYAEFMSSFDSSLQRGLKKSRARHSELRTWYSRLPTEIKREEIRLPSFRVRCPPPAITQTARRAWADEETARLRKALLSSLHRLIQARREALFVAQQFQLRYQTELQRTKAFRDIRLDPNGLRKWVLEYDQYLAQLSTLRGVAEHFEQLYVETIDELDEMETLNSRYGRVIEVMCHRLDISLEDLEYRLDRSETKSRIFAQLEEMVVVDADGLKND